MKVDLTKEEILTILNMIEYLGFEHRRNAWLIKNYGKDAKSIQEKMLLIFPESFKKIELNKSIKM